GPRVAFEIGQGVDDDTLPPEVMTTLHRVLLECLTNIRRHAPATDWVEVDLRRIDGKVWLRVRNRRSHSDSRVSRLGGGFGLVGMAERVEALGGRLWAGPTPDGCWGVRAVFWRSRESSSRTPGPASAGRVISGYRRGRR